MSNVYLIGKDGRGTAGRLGRMHAAILAPKDTEASESEIVKTDLARPSINCKTLAREVEEKGLTSLRPDRWRSAELIQEAKMSSCQLDRCQRED